MITGITENDNSLPPDLADLQQWRDEFGLTHPVMDAHDAVGPWAANTSPIFFVMDQNMLCQYRQEGFRPAEIITLIDSLIANPPTPMEATPTPVVTATPTPGMTETPMPTSTPGGGFEGVRLTLSEIFFQAGDTFLLSAEVDSMTLARADFYCALDVFGSYYFYPAWGADLDFETVTLPASFDVLGPFTWPSGAGAADGITFWGVATQPRTFDFFGEIAQVSFGFQ